MAVNFPGGLGGPLATGGIPKEETGARRPPPVPLALDLAVQALDRDLDYTGTIREKDVGPRRRLLGADA